MKYIVTLASVSTERYFVEAEQMKTELYTDFLKRVTDFAKSQSEDGEENSFDGFAHDSDFTVLSIEKEENLSEREKRICDDLLKFDPDSYTLSNEGV